jgi:hypothetical protein
VVPRQCATAQAAAPTGEDQGNRDQVLIPAHITARLTERVLRGAGGRAGAGGGRRALGDWGAAGGCLTAAEQKCYTEKSAGGSRRTRRAAASRSYSTVSTSKSVSNCAFSCAYQACYCHFPSDLLCCLQCVDPCKILCNGHLLLY